MAWLMLNRSVQVPQHSISPLLAFLFSVGLWSEVKFQIDSSQEVIIWWVKDGRRMVGLNQCNHTDITKAVVPKLSASFLPQPQLLPAHFSTSPAPSLVRALVHLQPRSALTQLTNLPEFYLLFLLDEWAAPVQQTVIRAAAGESAP